MLIRLSGTRLAAMLAVSAVVAWWMSGAEAETLAGYRALSHDALLAKLAERHTTGFRENFLGAAVVVGTVVAGVDVVHRALAWAAARLGITATAPSAPSAPSAPDAGAPGAG